MAGVSRVDLHTHTTASDGTCTPAELVGAALEAGLDVIAVTDHDTVAGVATAIAAASGTRLRVLPGVELSARVQDASLHLLGYGFQADDTRLAGQLDALAAGRERRMRRMLERLADQGIAITWEQVAALARGTVGRPHLAQALADAGYAQDVPDAFARLIGKDSPAYVRSAHLTPEEAIRMVREAGGEVAMAHPLLPASRWDLDALLPQLRQVGLSGVEVYHSEHDEAAVTRLRALAAAHGLWWSGGSDFHGAVKPTVRLGGVPVPAEVLDQGPFTQAR